MSTSRKLIGSIVKYHRQKNGLTLQQLGDKIGKDRQNVWKIENGKINTSCDTLDEIIKAMNCKHTDYINHKYISKPK